MRMICARASNTVPSPALWLALGLLVVTAPPSPAGVPRALGMFSLDAPRDSLLAAADRSGYHVDRDLGQMIDLVPADTSAPTLTASLNADGKVVRLWFIYRGIPTRERMESVEQDYMGWLGVPLDTTESEGIRQVRWLDDQTLCSLRAGLEGRRLSLQGNLYDRATFESAQTPPPPGPPGRRKTHRSSRKTTHKPKPAPGSSVK